MATDQASNPVWNWESFVPYTNRGECKMPTMRIAVRNKGAIGKTIGYCVVPLLRAVQTHDLMKESRPLLGENLKPLKAGAKPYGNVRLFLKKRFVFGSACR